MMQKHERIFVAGHRGLAGSAIKRALLKQGYNNIIVRTRAELDLQNQQAVNHFFETEKPDHVFLAAAKVGGIHANNTYRAEFLYNNLTIQSNVMHAAWKSGVKRLMFLGSSCIYPRNCPQPMKEEHLLTGTLEYTNEPYAVAKIAGIKTCEAFNTQYGTQFFSVMPTNLYGPNDNFDLQNAHVLPALLRKFHEAKVANDPRVTIWGSGQPKREFLHSDDMAAACVYLMNHPDFKEMTNIGSGQEISILELAQTLQEVVGYQGELHFDSTKPDGSPRKLLDLERLNALGWKSTIGLKDGLIDTYEWFLKNYKPT